MPATDYIDDSGIWIKLLGSVIKAAREDAVGLRRLGYLNPDGTLTAAGKARIGKRRKVNGHLCTTRDYMSVCDVKNLSDFIYNGGCDKFLAELGMPSVGETVRREVELEVVGKTSFRRFT